MTASIAQHEWLRRVSDYHSGGVSDAERAAVEAHLAACQECQEALAMYRRFYSLLRSPVRLGPPSPHLDEETTIVGNYPNPPSSAPSTPSTPSSPPEYQPSRPPRQSGRKRVLAGIAAVLAATLVVGGFVAVYAMRNLQPAASATATPQVTTAPTAAASATPAPTPKAQPPQFMCANPSGSNLTYVYQRGDGGLYIVSGCTLSAQLAVGAYASPLAWSPSNRYLAIQTSANSGTTYPVVLYDTSNGQQITTKFVGQAPLDAKAGDVVRTFLGWVDDNTFVGALQPVASGHNLDAPFGTSTIVKVDVASQNETQVGKIAWFAGTKIIAPGYLFYAGLQSMSEGQAYLHRLNLSNGADTKLVPLGEYGNGGCQVTPFCNWTAPWDVTPDGVNVIYHNPGPTGFPSDTGPVSDTPLVFARLDGSYPNSPFGTGLTSSLAGISFSPQGKYVFATGVTDKQVQQGDQWFRLAQIGGAVTDVHGIFLAWRGDNQALVIMANGSPQPLLYNLASQNTSTLEPNSNWYLWAH